MTRIYQAVALRSGETLRLDEQASHHLGRVLRVRLNEPVTIFNGQGGEYSGVVAAIEKKSVLVSLQDFSDREAESSLNLCLLQGISRGEKMDYTIQKAVELGVKKIVPLFTERCNVKLDQDRSEKRFRHWQSIVIGACEQSGRNRIPDLFLPQTLNTWFEQSQADFSFVLSPHVEQQLSGLTVPAASEIALLIGPEGGLSEQEIALAGKNDFMPLRLGPRILRTETAAVAALAVLQSRYGDLG